VRFPKHNGLNQKKGISSIVGGIFFLVLMTSGFTVYYVALDSQSQMLDTQQIIADTEVAKIKEKFVVAASSDPSDNNRLSIQVINTGNNPVEIADVWIINKTDAGEPATKYNDLDFRDVSIPIGYSGNILENHAPLNLISDIYDIKVISSLGTIQKVEFDVNGGSNILSAQMIAIPQDVRYGENVTIALIVTNVGTTNTITDVIGNTATLSISPNQCNDPPNPIFTGPANLSPSQSIMFFWDCVLNQPTGNVITITGNATGKILGVNVDSNDATDSVIVRDFTAGGEEIVLKEDLFGKPGIFMVIPSPFGWSPTGTKGLWGMNIVNPTSGNMWVNKAVVSLFPTSIGNVADNILKSGSCSPTGIVPPTDTWACTTDNQLKWEPTPGNQHLIPPKSVQQFLTVADEGKLVIDDELDTVLVTGSVFTTFGQFAKTGYGTAYQQSGQNHFPVVNVYLTRDENNPLIVSNIHTTELGMISGTPQTFHVVLADFDPDEDKFIKKDISRLIINIPQDWTLNSYSSDHFTIPPPITNPDNSIQIIGTLDYIIDGDGDDDDTLEAGIIEINITPPPVSDNKMYAMYILADGYTDANFLIGPIAEVVLQVCPVGGCS